MFAEKLTISQMDDFIQNYYLKNTNDEIKEKYLIKNATKIYPDKVEDRGAIIADFGKVRFIFGDFLFIFSASCVMPNKIWKKFMYNIFGEEYKQEYIKYATKRKRTEIKKMQEELAKDIEEIDKSFEK